MAEGTPDLLGDGDPAKFTMSHINENTRNVCKECRRKENG